MTYSVRSLWRVVCLTLCLLAWPAAWAGQVKYPAFYVFGDSLSDTGNDIIGSTSQGFAPVPPPAVYWQGRFSNGPVAAEYLWRLVSRKPNAELEPSLSDPALAKPALSFAFGGSGTGVSNPTPMGVQVVGLLGQVGMFNQSLAGRRADGKALYMVWSGANDYLLPGPLPSAATVQNAIGNVRSAIQALHAAGARDFIVPNLPDMGNTPFVKAMGQGPAFTQLTRQHNAQLKSMLAQLARDLRPARIVTVDVYKLGETLLSTGLINDELPALEFLAPGQGAAECMFVAAPCPTVAQPQFLPPFLYWDVMHPTTQVHGVISTAMFAALLLQK